MDEWRERGGMSRVEQVGGGGGGWGGRLLEHLPAAVAGFETDGSSERF